MFVFEELVQLYFYALNPNIQLPALDCQLLARFLVHLVFYGLPQCHLTLHKELRGDQAQRGSKETVWAAGSRQAANCLQQAPRKGFSLEWLTSHFLDATWPDILEDLQSTFHLLSVFHKKRATADMGAGTGHFARKPCLGGHSSSFPMAEHSSKEAVSLSQGRREEPDITGVERCSIHFDLPILVLRLNPKLATIQSHSRCTLSLRQNTQQ